MLTKVTKHKNKSRAKKQTWAQLFFAVPWIIRNKPLPPILECLPLSYTFVSYCNGLLKILQTVGYKFSLSVAYPRAKKLSASGGLCPLTRGSAPGSRWGSCSMRSPCASPKKLSIPPCSSTLAPTLMRSRLVHILDATSVLQISMRDHHSILNL